MRGPGRGSRRARPGTKLAERERERNEREDAGGLPWRAVERPVADPETDGNQPHRVEPWTRERERDEQENEEVTPHDRREHECGRDRKAETAPAPCECQDANPDDAGDDPCRGVGKADVRQQREQGVRLVLEGVAEPTEEARVLADPDERHEQQQRGAGGQGGDEGGADAADEGQPDADGPQEELHGDPVAEREPGWQGVVAVPPHQRDEQGQRQRCVRSLHRFDRRGPEQHDPVDTPVADVEDPSAATSAASTSAVAIHSATPAGTTVSGTTGSTAAIGHSRFARSDRSAPGASYASRPLTTACACRYSS